MIQQVAIEGLHLKKIRRRRALEWIRHYAKKMPDGKIRVRKDRELQRIEDCKKARRRVNDDDEDDDKKRRR